MRILGRSEGESVVSGASGRAEGAIVRFGSWEAGGGLWSSEAREVVRCEGNREELKSDLGNQETRNSEKGSGSKVTRTTQSKPYIHNGSDVALGGGVTAFLFVHNKPDQDPPRSSAPR